VADYDRIYTDHADFFGADPSPLLARFTDHIPDGSRILDIGVGQGRHALPLARRGFRITGIDTSGVAIETVRDRARQEHLHLDLWRGHFLEYQPTNGLFGAVLVFGLLQMLGRREGASLLFRLREWTLPGGLVFLTAWHVDDPSYSHISQTWTPIGLHSFRSSEGECRTFLARSEIRDLMLGWGILHHWEGLGPEHRHADGPVERHGAVELVAVRPG
jgi:SAM-dependent methyltransferase